MKTAADFLKYQAESHHFTCTESYDKDYDLWPDGDRTNAGDVIQIMVLLHEKGFKVFPQRDNSLHVHAPHRKEHSWFDRGWNCESGLTPTGCIEFGVKVAKAPVSAVEIMEAVYDLIEGEYLVSAETQEIVDSATAEDTLKAIEERDQEWQVPK